MAATTQRDVQTLLDIFGRPDLIDAETARQVLEKNKGNIQGALDDLLVLTEDNAIRSVIASQALYHGYISPAIVSSARPPSIVGPSSSPAGGPSSRPVVETELQAIQRQEREAAARRAGLAVIPHDPSHVPPSPYGESGPIHYLRPGDDPMQFLTAVPSASSRPALEKLAAEAREHQFQVQQKRAQELRVEEEKARIARERDEAHLAEIRREREALALEQQRVQTLAEQQELERRRIANQQAAVEIQQRIAEEARLKNLQTQQQLEQQRLELEAQAQLMRANTDPQRAETIPHVAEADASAHATPTVGIYYTSSATPEQIADSQYIKGRFLTHMIPESQIRVCDITNDEELRQWIASKQPGTKNPMVFVHDYPIGDRADVDALLASGGLATFLAAPGTKVDASNPADAPTVGFFSGMLNVTEVLASSVSAVLSAPWELTKMLIWGKEEPKKEEGIEFLVVHQNWYWRNLWRIFKFTDTEVLRIHPSHGDVRARHPYTEILCVRCVDINNIIIDYRGPKDSRPPSDYIFASQADIIRMKVLFNERSHGAIRIAPHSELGELDE